MCVASLNHKLKCFGEYCFQVREGLEVNVQIRGLGSSGKVLLIAANMKYYHFCFRPYFKALMILRCFEISWLKVICKGKAVLCNKHIRPWWCYFRVSKVQLRWDCSEYFYVLFSDCSTCWRSWDSPAPMLKPFKPSFAVASITFLLKKCLHLLCS